MEGRYPIGPTIGEEREAGKMECCNGIRFGISSVEVVGVDKLEESLIVEEFGEGMVWVWVGQFITGSLPRAGIVEARESADRVGYGSSRLLDNNLERKRKKRSSDRLLLS